MDCSDVSLQQFQIVFYNTAEMLVLMKFDELLLGIIWRQDCQHILDLII